MTDAIAREPWGPPTFAPPGRARTALILALGSDATLSWVVVVGFYTLVNRLWRGLGERFLPGSSLETHWSQIEAARRLQGLAWVVTAVLFLVWLHRVYANLAALGARRMRFSPRWAVGTFFLPVLNLVWPFLVMREVWNGSDPDPAGDEAAPPANAVPWVVAWWTLFVGATLLDPGPWRLVEDLRSHLSLGGPTVVLIAAQLAEIAAAVLAIVVVLKVDERQVRRWRALGGG